MPYMNKRNADRLVNTYRDVIQRVSYSYLGQVYDAEDICQNVFLKLLSRELRFENAEHEKAWIIRTTINACKDHLRRYSRKHETALEEAGDLPSAEERESELLELVKELPENYRSSIYLRYYEGYSVQEIASILGKNENTVSAYLSRGRRKLKEIFDKQHKQMIAVAVTLGLLITAGTGFAAARFLFYEAYSSGNYEYGTIKEFNQAVLGNPGISETAILTLPETLCGTYRFEGGSVVGVLERDDEEMIHGEWKEYRAGYRNLQGFTVDVILSDELSVDRETEPTERRAINGIEVLYDDEEYLVLPDEGEELTVEITRRLAEDDHFHVSYGSSWPESFFFHVISFEKDGIAYRIYTKDDVTVDEMFAIAEELADRE